MAWRSIGVDAQELRCDVTLTNGQAFNWRPHGDEKALEWIGVLGRQVVILRQGANDTFFRLPTLLSSPSATITEAVDSTRLGDEKSKAPHRRTDEKSTIQTTGTTITRLCAETSQVLHRRKDEKVRRHTLVELSPECKPKVPVAAISTNSRAKWTSTERAIWVLLRLYFRLSVCAKECVAIWSARDPRMRAIATSLSGLRLLQIDPVECLFAFICSSNNHIARIHKMLDALRKEYGTLIGWYAKPGKQKRGDTPAWFAYYTFPTVEALATRATEQRLRELGFGYRARFVVETAKQVASYGGVIWLWQLRATSNHATVTRELLNLSGVGPKVADCVALFSLNQSNIVPLDTHMFQV